MGKPRWQRILDLEAQAKGIPPLPDQSLSNPDRAPVEQIAKDVRVVRNVAVIELLPKLVPGAFALWMIYMIFLR